MWQSLNNLVSGDSRALQVLVVVVIFAVVVGVLYGLYRLVFAHRLHAPGAARGRAPRLGVVDVYPLDGQRQLVIVRRDNVEHLLMIGGPNDIVIEPQIVRNANGVTAREAVKPASPVEPFAEPPPRPAAPAVATAAPRRAAPMRAAPPAAEVTPPVTESAPVAPETPPAPEPPRSRPLPTPRAEAPRPAAEPVRPVAEAAKPAAEPAPRPLEITPEPKPAADLTPPRRPLTPSKPATLAPRPHLPLPITPLRPRNVEPPPVEAQKSVAVVEPSKAPEVAIAPQPAAAPVAAPAPVIVTPPPAEKPHGRGEETFYDLESLEAEMARLLGRDGG